MANKKGSLIICVRVFLVMKCNAYILQALPEVPSHFMFVTPPPVALREHSRTCIVAVHCPCFALSVD